MNKLTTIRINEIKKLHTEINGLIKTSLEKAIRIGELLTEQKAELKHGNFLKWISNNLQFTDRTARNYMNCFKNKDRLKTETISDLTNAYKLLEEPKKIVNNEPVSIKNLTGLFSIDEILSRLGIEADCEYWTVTEVGIQFRKLFIPMSEIEKLLLAVSKIKFENEFERFLIGDVLNYMDKMIKAANYDNLHSLSELSRILNDVIEILAAGRLKTEREMGKTLIEFKDKGYKEKDILALINGRITPEELFNSIQL